MTDGVNTVMKAMNPASLRAIVDSLTIKSGRKELARTEDAMLSGRDSRDHGLLNGAFVRHTLTKAPGPGLHPFLAGFRSAERRPRAISGPWPPPLVC